MEISGFMNQHSPLTVLVKFVIFSDFKKSRNFAQKIIKKSIFTFLALD
jgi:hypothetical protein